MTVEDGSRIGVIGGGPSGSLFSYFLLLMAERIGISLAGDVYEPRDFNQEGPAGCNMCGGIVSESMVQLLSTEGLNLPPSVVQRGIDSYVLKMDVGSVRTRPPGARRGLPRCTAVGGPRGITKQEYESFDDYLLKLAEEKGPR
jgi:hypothetical protein